jgi:hypothetical protein
MILEILTGAGIMFVGTLLGACIARKNSDSPEEVVEEKPLLRAIPRQKTTLED